jgi:hypothetical protein
MSAADASVDPEAPPPAATLRRLFLTLFLRGRGARGLRRQSAPKSIGRKLGFILGIYALVGCLALLFLHQSVFALGVYLHAMTFMFLGMFVAASSGEILFNKEEADILLHRPIEPRTLLWAKVRVLVEVSLWLGGAFNLAGLFVGLAASDGGWRFPIAHAISTTLEAMFCTGSVILVYQICLSCFGRGRLEGLMTTAQVVVSVAAILGGQILPRLIFHGASITRLGMHSWWIGLLPPAWFAGLDDALAGSGARNSWLLALLAAGATAGVLGLAFGRLARSYEAGLRSLNESSSPRVPGRGGRRWLNMLANSSPLHWGFHDSVACASFVLTGAYLFRDRDVKLRMYPGLAPMLIMPFLIMFQGRSSGGLPVDSFGVAYASSCLGLIPLMGLNLLQYSQQWQAADVFRLAPVAGPARICRGARWAILCFLAVPLLAVFGLAIRLLEGRGSDWVLLLPGLVALPIYALVPNLGGKAVPLSFAIEDAKSVGRGLVFLPVMLISFAISGLSVWARSGGWFWPFVLVEFVVAVIVYVPMSRSIAAVSWPALE